MKKGFILPIFLFAVFVSQVLSYASESLVEASIENPELDKRFGRVRTVNHRYCPGLEVTVVERITSLDIYVSKFSDYPTFFNLNMTGHSIRLLEGSFNPRELFLSPVEKKVASVEILGPQFSYQWNLECHIGPSVASYDDDHIYQLPFESGQLLRVSQGFGGFQKGEGSHTKGQHYAVDWPMPVGTTILAARTGIVLTTEDGIELNGAYSERWDAEYNHVYILHGDGSVARYIHLNQNSVTVSEGQIVTAGQKIGESGNTGYSSGPHLHFDVKVPRDAITFDLPTDTPFWSSSIGVPVRFRTDSGVTESISTGDIHGRSLPRQDHVHEVSGRIQLPFYPRKMFKGHPFWSDISLKKYDSSHSTVARTAYPKKNKHLTTPNGSF